MAAGFDGIAVDPGKLAKSIEEYLSDHPAAAVLEDGRVLFDMRTARYSVTEQHGRCLLQLWNDERNLMRTVVEIAERAQCLRLMTRRMGAAKPQALRFPQRLLSLLVAQDHDQCGGRAGVQRDLERLAHLWVR